MKKDLGYLGECYVQLELAKRNFKVFKVFNLGFDFLGENNARIEVKTALPSLNRSYKEKVNKIYEYRYWQFKLSTEKERNSDFFVCVVLEDLEKPPLGYFIIPKNAVGSLGRSDMIAIFDSDIKGEFKKANKEDKHQYFNNWNLILNFLKKEAK